MEKLKTYKLYSQWNTFVKTVKARSESEAVEMYFRTWDRKNDKWVKYAIEV